MGSSTKKQESGDQWVMVEGNGSRYPCLIKDAFLHSTKDIPKLRFKCYVLNFLILIPLIAWIEKTIERQLGLKINIHKSNIYGIGVNKDEVLSMASNVVVLQTLLSYRNSVTFNSQPLRKSDLFDNVRFSSFSWLHNRDHMKLSWNDWLMLSIDRVVMAMVKAAFGFFLKLRVHDVQFAGVGVPIVERAFRRERTWAGCGPCWQYPTNIENVPSLLTPS
ncbi:hypothetical protein Tco_1326724 [Tanacetum coccineum]